VVAAEGEVVDHRAADGLGGAAQTRRLTNDGAWVVVVRDREVVSAPTYPLQAIGLSKHDPGAANAQRAGSDPAAVRVPVAAAAAKRERFVLHQQGVVSLTVVCLLIDQQA